MNWFKRIPCTGEIHFPIVCDKLKVSKPGSPDLPSVPATYRRIVIKTSSYHPVSTETANKMVRDTQTSSV